MKNPLVSIIIPTYNDEKTIGKIIERTLGQPYKNVEIIVVNDGSQDATADVVGEYVDMDSRLKMVTQENEGASGARNAGIKIATGDYVMFFDADDDVEDEMIEKMVGLIEKNKTSLVVCGQLINDRALLPDKTGIIKNDLKAHVVNAILKNGLLYSPCNKIYNMQTIRDNDIQFDVKVGYGEDLIFNLEYLGFVDSIYYVRKPFYKYKHTQEGYSAKNAVSKKYRGAMYDALKNYVGDASRNVKVRFAMRLVKMRWGASVYKAKIIGRADG